jgi:hypothetical protein
MLLVSGSQTGNDDIHYFSLLKSSCVAEVVVTNGDIRSEKEEKGTMGTNILLVKNTIHSCIL